MTLLRSVLLTVLATPAAAQSVLSVTPSEAPRSDRVVIVGTGFGEAQEGSQVLIGGVPAIITYWSDQRVRAHVAEPSPLGPVVLEVVTDSGSDSIPITVLAHDPKQKGHIRWMQRTDHFYSLARPAIGPDGTIYVTGGAGPLTAVTPDGVVTWALPGAGGVRPATVGQDGTVYTVGPAHSITALSPDGNFLWGFNTPDNAGGTFVGPNVGPDGKIYAVTEEEPTLGTDYGAFALRPDGSLAWHTSGGYNFRHSPLGWEIVFGDGQLYFATGQGFPLYGNPGVHALDADSGVEQWLRVGIGKVQTDLDGNIYWLGAINNNYIGSYRPDGAERWTINYNEFGGQPGGFVVAPDGTSVFCTSTNTKLAAIETDGAIRWSMVPGPYLYTVWGITRDAQRFMSIACPVDNTAPLLRLQSAADGSILWEQGLPFENGVWMGTAWEGNFSPDGRTFYLVLHGNNSIDDPYCYLIAIDVSEPCYPDFTQDGTLDLFDFLGYLNVFNDGNESADCDQNGPLDLFDFLCFVNAFNQGC
jgi:hypothetical protein